MQIKKVMRLGLSWLLAAALLAPFAWIGTPGALAAADEYVPLPLEDEWLPVGGVSPIEVVAVYEEIVVDIPAIAAEAPNAPVPGGTTYGYDWISNPANTGADAAVLTWLYEKFMTAGEAAWTSTATFQSQPGSAGYVQNGPVDVSSLNLPYSAAATPATDATKALIKLAISAFTNDNPQFYMYTGGYSLTYSSVVNTLTLSIFADYASPAARQAAQAKIESKYAEYKALADTVTSDYDKIRLVHDKMLAERDYSYVYIDAGTIIGNTQYTSAGYYADPYASAHNILGVMDTSTNGPVCEAFAEAFSYILHRLGVGDAITVVGMAKSGGGDGSGGHAWNLVKIGGNYYCVDATWDNRDNTFPSSNNYDDGNKINDLYYKYFLVGSGNTDFGAGNNSGAVHWAGGTAEVTGNEFVLYGLPAVSAFDYTEPSAHAYLTDNGYYGKRASSGSTVTTADDYDYSIGKSNKLLGTKEENALWVLVGGSSYGWNCGPFHAGEVEVGATPTIPLYRWAYDNTKPSATTMFKDDGYTALTQGTDYTVTVEPGAAGDTVRAWLTGAGAYRGIDFVMIDLTPASQPTAYTVTFDAQGGAVNPASGTTNADGKLTALPTPTRSGYTFAGWYTAATGGTLVELSRVYTANDTIYARWTAEQPTAYTVTFDAQGGAVNPTSGVTGADGKLAALPTPTRSGYTFAGWFTAATGGTLVELSRVYTANDTIYARWTTEEPTAYTVTFDANGGTVYPASAQTGTGNRLTELPIPATRKGYVFDGWYTAADGGAQVTASRVYTADTTIYARWTKLEAPKGEGVEVMVIAKALPTVQVVVAIFFNGVVLYQETFPKS